MRITASVALLLAAAHSRPPHHPPPDALAAASLLDLLAIDGDAAAKTAPEREQLERSAAAEAVLAAVSRLEAPREMELARRLRVLADSGTQLEETAAVARLLQRSLESRFGLVFEPRRAPDVAAGARIYAQSCAACHAGSLQLETPAPDLRDAALRFTPRHVYHVVGTGVPESPMPSFSDSLNDDQRWDLAFYVASMPSAATSIGVNRPPARGFRQLAAASDELLRLQLEAEGDRGIDQALSAIRNGPFSDQEGPIALAVPAPLELLQEELRDETGADVERAVLRAPRWPGLLASIRNLSRQMLLRRQRPPVDLSLLVQDSSGVPLGSCNLISDEEVACDVTPGIESMR